MQKLWTQKVPTGQLVLKLGVFSGQENLPPLISTDQLMEALATQMIMSGTRIQKIPLINEYYDL